MYFICSFFVSLIKECSNYVIFQNRLLWLKQCVSDTRKRIILTFTYKNELCVRKIGKKYNHTKATAATVVVTNPVVVVVVVVDYSVKPIELNVLYNSSADSKCFSQSK